jgi:hypothetical protein
MEYTSGPFKWDSKKEAGLFFGQWLREAIPVHVVTDSERHHCLLDLISKHPEAEHKIGVGVDRFEIRLNPIFKNQNTFYLIRVNGTSTDFSFRSCITGRKKTAWALFCDAARNAVADQILVFKSSAFMEVDRPACGITGNPVLWNNCHVDHVVEFSELIRKFVEQNGIDVSSAVKPSSDMQIVAEFISDDLRRKWCEYHRTFAELRLTTPEANLARSTKGTFEHLTPTEFNALKQQQLDALKQWDDQRKLVDGPT